MEALNALLLAGCRADEARVLAGRSRSVGAAMTEERGYLLACAAEDFDLAERVIAVVDKQGCITVKTNLYSVPLRPGSRVEARVGPLHIEIWPGRSRWRNGARLAVGLPASMRCGIGYGRDTAARTARVPWSRC